MFVVGRHGFAFYNIVLGVINLQGLFLIKRSGKGALLIQLTRSALFLLGTKLFNASH